MPFFPPNNRPGSFSQFPQRPPFGRPPGNLPQGPNLWNQYGSQPEQKPGLTGNLSKMMSHVGTISNGINMMKQVGSMLSLFK
ncbi:hypothetical protein [Pseudalkalibacillus caeni]|uniref:Uncharacterized protein n=1 Tax=Exobacillus caeni TaxID=2574798 RepID=A0A5R9F3R4_9BACL|nr:hypothetical protein [Pseudalkalibacillus caeni]TLS37040.1 hypothetical protein FCL54_10940 [Pseudalkalibacillus caeni]